MRSHWAALALVFALARPALADQPVHDVEAWTLVSVQGDVVDDVFGAYMELQQRTTVYSPRDRFDRSIVRPAVYVRLERVLTFWAGYAYAPIWKPEFVEEHRAWQQVMLETPFSDDPAPLRLTNRIRLEQRFIDRNQDPSVRLRYLARFQIPLEDDEIVALAFWNEIFVNLNDVTSGPRRSRRGFDQNRFFVGPHVNLDKKVGLDVGYLLVFEDRDRDACRHALFLWLMIGF